MTMRRFYRSRLFWLGVPGLVFLLWVWWDSGGYRSHVRWEPPGEVHEVEVARGRVEWEHTRYVKGSTLWVRAGDPFTVGRGKQSNSFKGWLLEGNGRARQFDLPAAAYERRVTTPVDITTFGPVGERVTWGVALWVVIGAYVMVWAAMDFAWQWRKKRAMNNLTEAEVAS